ncbi:MAG: Ribonuclease [Promethearchaeota archaeon]|nr:MAG: Ribonuclease [Candidatus Lokiarchaeota archaeon]
MVKISFLGSCREVGRSAVLIESKKGDQLMLDYGVRFSKEARLPVEADLSHLKAVALTHCHVDHCGALPSLYSNHHRPPLFTNEVSLVIAEKLIYDMLKISRYPYPFGKHEIEEMKKNAQFLEVGMKQKIAHEFYLTFYNAGHIPGSVSILVEVDGKKILYSGDINTIPTNLVEATTSRIIPEIDAAIVESTYALRKHSPREDLEKKFVENTMGTIENGGKVLVPAFSVARSQEALMILDKYHYRGKLFLDGLGTLISKIYYDYPNELKNKLHYRKAMSKVNFVNRRRKRELAKKSNGVIVSSSGMLKGGAAMEYIKPILKDPSSAIYLVGYQVEGTPGRQLIDEGIFHFEEHNISRRTDYDINIKAQCAVKHFDFSSHSDGEELHNYVDNLRFTNHSKEVFCIHGDNESTGTFAKQLVNKGYTSVAPEDGETYRI